MGSKQLMELEKQVMKMSDVLIKIKCHASNLDEAKKWAVEAVDEFRESL